MRLFGRSIHPPSNKERSKAMKKNLLFKIVFSSVLLLIFGCAAHTKFADYQPNSADEKEVFYFMQECNDAYLNRNYTKWLACFDDNATIKSYRQDWTAPTLSKKEYEGNVASYAVGMENNFFDPKINNMGDRATITCLERKEGVEYVKHTFILVKDSEKWSIVKWDYSWMR
jgi:hypothetical protein